jgi:hypothetical protein
MFQSLKDLLKSKKFQVAVCSILAMVFTALSGAMPWSEVIDKAWPIVLVLLGAQGLADFGKAAAAAKAAAPRAPVADVTSDGPELEEKKA